MFVGSGVGDVVILWSVFVEMLVRRVVCKVEDIDILMDFKDKFVFWW